MKRKLLFILLGIASLAFSVYCVTDFIAMARRSHTQSLARELATIGDRLQNAQPGIPRAEEFLHRLKAVDPGLAPPEVKNALRDYIAALEGSLQAMKSGQDASKYDLQMAQAKERLAVAFRKYD